MPKRTLLSSAVVFAIATAPFAGEAAADVLKREPPIGQLREGQIR